MLAAPLNRIRLHCVVAAIQCSTKDLGNWLIFPRWQGGNHSYMSMRNVFVYNFWDAFQIRRASILNEAISWIEGNAIFDDAYVCLLLRFSRTFRISESFRMHDDFIYSIPKLFLQSLSLASILKFYTIYLELLSSEKYVKNMS